MHFGRLHRGNRQNWITELRGEDADDLVPSMTDPNGKIRHSNRRATNLGTVQDFADRLLGDDHDCEDDGCTEWIPLPDGAKAIRASGPVKLGQVIRLLADGTYTTFTGEGLHGLAPGEVIYVAKGDIHAGSTGWVVPANR